MGIRRRIRIHCNYNWHVGKLIDAQCIEFTLLIGFPVSHYVLRTHLEGPWASRNNTPICSTHFLCF